MRRSLLESSLAQTHRLAAHLAEASIPFTPHPRMENETAPCCNNCLDEVFNMLFVLSHKGEYLVYCHKCAMAMEKSFTVLRQVSMSNKRVCTSCAEYVNYHHVDRGYWFNLSYLCRIIM